MGGDDDRLSRSAIVTGAAGGIGRAIAVRLARDGLALTVVDLPTAAHQLGALVTRADGRRGPGGGGGG
jgi:meso-butanediol dehydrogenase/(S,S)-butanediol dehydrogenase/diacetyl reductase